MTIAKLVVTFLLKYLILKRCSIFPFQNAIPEILSVSPKAEFCKKQQSFEKQPRFKVV